MVRAPPLRGCESTLQLGNHVGTPMLSFYNMKWSTGSSHSPEHGVNHFAKDVGNTIRDDGICVDIAMIGLEVIVYLSSVGITSTNFARLAQQNEN